MSFEDWMTVQEVSKMLGVSQATLSRWRTGTDGPRLRFMKIGGARQSKVLYDRRGVEAFLKDAVRI